MNNIPFAKQANFTHYLDFYQKCLSMRDEIPLLYRFFDSRRLLNHTHVLSVLLCLISNWYPVLVYLFNFWLVSTSNGDYHVMQCWEIRCEIPQHNNLDVSLKGIYTIYAYFIIYFLLQTCLSTFDILILWRCVLLLQNLHPVKENCTIFQTKS
jgi:hypothetical protein